MPKISLVASSIRPHLWNDMYQSLLSNNISWEVVMVGPNPGTPPPNFKYIQSHVKPAQCYEIGFRNATGELISWTADDATYSPGALDQAYEHWKALNNRKAMIAFRTVEDGRDITDVHRLRGRDNSAPRMAPFGLINREFFNELGGYDRRFMCGQSENDIVMRVYEAGGMLEVSNTASALVHHEKAHFSGTVFRQEYYHHDRRVLENSWICNGQILTKRSDPVEPFDNKEILTKTQGPFGIW